MHDDETKENCIENFANYVFLGQADDWKDGRSVGRSVGRSDGRTDGQMDGQSVRWTDGLTDEWTDKAQKRGFLNSSSN